MILEVTIGILILFYLFHKWHFSYWQRRDVFSISNTFNYQVVKALLWDKTMPERMFSDLYKKHKQERLVGFFILYRPMVLLTDPELVRTVMVKDFNKFVDTGAVVHEKTDLLLSMNPFFAKGMERWKELRGIQAVMQTPSKFKEMVPDIMKTANRMVSYIKDRKSNSVEVKDLLFRYTVDNISSNGFGIEPTAFTDPDNGFMKHANSEKMFDSPNSFVIHFLMPFISNLLRMRILSTEAEDFFKTIVGNVMNHREKSNASRNDLIDSIRKINKKHEMANRKAYTKDDIAGHCMTFYFDGSETTSVMMSFLFLDIANHPDVQEKLRLEISSVSKNPEKFDLDQINSLKYLDMVINESLRYHSLLDVIHRTCTQDTSLGGKQISKGTTVCLPIAPFHSDPEYFPEPDKFNPERFSEEKKDSIVPYSFIPFGGGPRICVGFKYALLQTKLAVIFLLLNFKIDPSTQNDIIDKTHPFLSPSKEAALLFHPL